ncbi:MAG: 50S ribosomal protein L9 [Chlamydiota bacterium]
MKQQLLLLQDIESLGKKGEVVSAKPGYVRNFLLHKGRAVVASVNTLRKQEALRKERAKQAIVDRQESEELMKQVESVALDIRVKVDPEGHMYGSVSAGDIAQLFQEKGIPIEKKNVQLNKPIKATGAHKLVLKLKEGILVNFQLTIIPEGVNVQGMEAVIAPIPVESSKEASKSE